MHTSQCDCSICGQLLSIFPALCELTSQHEQPYATLLATLAWAARYNTWLLIELTPKGAVFPFLILFFATRDSGCSTINAIMGSFGNSFTAFVFPTGAYLWVYRTAAARANAPKQPL